MPSIEMATTSPDHITPDMQDAFRFWYRVYVVEMGRHLNDPLTDHNRRELADPVTGEATLLVARDARRQVVGTVMTTRADAPVMQGYRDLYRLHARPAAELAQSSITTKLMVSPELRRSRLPMQLVQAAYRHARQHAITFDYIDCNDHLVAFFEKWGYRRHLGAIFHAKYGWVNSMRIDLSDIHHLRQCGSPLYRIYLRETAAAAAKQLNEEANHVYA